MRKINKVKYIAIFASTLLIFLSGLLVGQAISEYKMQDLVKTQQELRLHVLGLTLQNELAKEKICSINPFKLTEEKNMLAAKLTGLEADLGNENPEVLSLKEEYVLLSIQQWMLVQKWREACGKELIPILFFYSNKINSQASKDQGYVLDYIYKNNKKTVVIYALDSDINNPALNTLKSIFNVTGAPSLVINNKVYNGFQTKEKILNILEKLK